MQLRLLSFLFLSSIINSYCADTTRSKTFISYNSISMVDLLKYLNESGDINHQGASSAYSLLFNEVYYNQIDVVELLIMRGADVDLPLYNKSTPLFAACFNGHLEIVRLLLCHKANPNEKNFYNVTPLVLAVKKNHIDVVKLLIKHRAHITRAELNDLNISDDMRKLLESSACIIE